MPKQLTRVIRVPDGTRTEAVQSLIDSASPAKQKLVMKGEPRFIRSGSITRIILAEDPNIWLIEDSSVESFAPHVVSKTTRIKFAGSHSHHNMKSRIAWLLRIGPEPHTVFISYHGESPPLLGERYYLESLPQVVGNTAIEVNRCVAFTDLAFPHRNRGSSDGHIP